MPLEGESAPVRISEPVQETTAPEANLIDRLQSFYSAIGVITHKSKIKSKSGSITTRTTDRPLGLRTKRADLLQEVKKALKEGDKQQAKEILQEAKELDEIYQQFYHQSDIEVDLPDLGTQKARFLEIKPAKSTKDEKPIFIIPTISADLEPMREFVCEIAKQGRSVICAGYPEATLGSVTREFVQAVEQAKDFTIHAEYFKAIIKQLQNRFPDGIELWGYSTGAPIAAEILTDEKMQQYISDAVFAAPAGVFDQPFASFAAGLQTELKYLVGKVSRLPKYPFIWGRKEPELDEESKLKEQGELKGKVFADHLKKIRQSNSAWKKVRVKEGGRMRMISCGQDFLTKSHLAELKISDSNERIEILRFPDAAHSTPLTEPEEFIKAALKT